MTKKQNDYNINDIKILKWLEAIRERPWMYIWWKDKKALHHILYEVINNAVDEFLAGFGDQLIIKFKEDWFIEVSDNARWIPVDIHPKYWKSVLELLVSELHAWGKIWDSKIYNTSWWLNGIWVKATNALSEYFEVIVCRNWKKYSIKYKKWNKVQDLKEIWKCDNSWTTVIFKPDETIFWKTQINKNEIIEYIRMNAYLLPNVKFIIVDEEINKKYEFHWKNIKDLLNEKIKEKQTKKIVKEIEWSIKWETEINWIEKEVKAKFVFTYADDENEVIKSFVNNIYTPENWSHVKWFVKWLKKWVLKFAKNINYKFSIKGTIQLSDFMKWLYLILTVYEKEPDFFGQTKYALADMFAEKVIEKEIEKFMYEYLNKNIKDWKKILKKIEENAKTRLKIDDIINKVKIKQDWIFVWWWKWKLHDAISNDVSIRELYLVEWDSALGTVLLSKNNLFQAALALKGKVINVQTWNLKKVLENDEVKSIINTIWTWIWKSFDINKIRYNKIIINTDEDADWQHITALLITLFYKLMPEIIEKWYLYKVKWPLFSITIWEKKYYFETEEEKNKFLSKLKDSDKKKAIVTRFKWLWEMPPNVFKDTMLDPKKRKLLKITMSDAEEVYEIISRLMWNDSEYKLEIVNMFWKEWIDL